MSDNRKKYNNANDLLMHDWRAKEYYLTFGEQAMGSVMLHSTQIGSYDDLKAFGRPGEK